MEQKNFRIVKNILLPIKTNITIDEDFIQIGKKKINWRDVKACSAHIMSVNRATNYIVAMDGINGEKVQLNIVHALTAKKKKKEDFADIYNSTIAQLEKYHILPKAAEIMKDIERGNEVTLAKAVFSNKGVEVLKGLVKKEKVFIPMEDINLEFVDGSGGFNLISKSNSKDRQFIQMANPDSRYILEIMSNFVEAPQQPVADAAPDTP